MQSSRCLHHFVSELVSDLLAHMSQAWTFHIALLCLPRRFVHWQPSLPSLVVVVPVVLILSPQSISFLLQILLLTSCLVEILSWKNVCFLSVLLFHPPLQIWYLPAPFGVDSDLFLFLFRLKCALQIEQCEAAERSWFSLGDMLSGSMLLHSHGYGSQFVRFWAPQFIKPTVRNPSSSWSLQSSNVSVVSVSPVSFSSSSCVLLLFQQRWDPSSIV